MLYDNNFGGFIPQQNINPYMQNYTAKPVNQPVGGSFIWVNSRKEAEEFPLGPNGAQMMMNRSEKVFYLKSCDGFGMVKSFQEFAYTERNISDESQNIAAEVSNSAEYVNREEFEALKAEFEKLKNTSSAKKTTEAKQNEK